MNESGFGQGVLGGGIGRCRYSSIWRKRGAGPEHRLRERKPISGLNPGDLAFGWTGNGRSVYVYQPSVPARIYQVELDSGHRQLWRELNPPDPAGVTFIRAPHISENGKAYAYNYNRILSDLYLVDGLR